MVHQVFGGKLDHFYDFPQKTVHEFNDGKKCNLTTTTEVRCDFWAISFNRELLLTRVKLYFTFLVVTLIHG